MNDAHDNALDDKAILKRLMEHPTRAYNVTDELTGAVVPMVCPECGQRVYYDYADDAYHHVEES
jgi:hypothetical protein